MVIARLTTVSVSLSILLNGQSEYFRDKGHTYYMASGPSGHTIKDEFYTELPLVRRPHLLKDIKSLIATFFWLRKIKPDILHTHTPKAGLIGMLAGFFAGVPVRLHTVAGVPWMESTGLIRHIYRFLEALTYFFAKKVYPNSNGLYQFLLNQIPSAKSKYKVLGNGSSNGIDTDYFSIDRINESKVELRNKYGIPLNAFVWVFVGRLVKDKGINELVSAFIKLPSNHTLLLVGPFEDDQDPISEETRSIIKSNPLIFTFGFQNDVRPFLKMADALVFPSYREGFPNVPMQAAAMNLPQIVSDINGCNEIVIPGVTGLLIPPKDVKSLYLSMILLSENDLLSQKFAINSRVSITERYARQTIWRHLNNEYDNLLINCK